MSDEGSAGDDGSGMMDRWSSAASRVHSMGVEADTTRKPAKQSFAVQFSAETEGTTREKNKKAMLT
jgi:hypothetical protein